MRCLHLGSARDNPSDVDRDSWTACLKLATMWHLDALRRIAIAELDHQGWDPVEKAIAGRDYRVARWLEDGYEEILRGDILADGMKVADKLGPWTACQLYLIRDNSWRDAVEHGGCSGDVRDRQQGYDFGKDIRAVFDEELRLDDEYQPVKSIPVVMPYLECRRMTIL